MRVKMVKLSIFDEHLLINFQGFSKCKATQSLHSLFLVKSSSCAVIVPFFAF